MYVIMNLMHLGSQIRRSLHENSLCDIDYSYTSLKSILDDVMLIQSGHGTGKTGNLAVNFSRQGKHREFSKFNFLHRENCGNTGKILKI